MKVSYNLYNITQVHQAEIKATVIKNIDGKMNSYLKSIASHATQSLTIKIERNKKNKYIATFLMNLDGKSYVYKTNLIIGHFNDDAENDTLVAVAKQDKMFYPKYIAWGNNQYILNDTTLFVYPSWEKLKVRCSYDFLNNDELIDLTFILWGQLEINDTTFKDTSMAFVI